MARLLTDTRVNVNATDVCSETALLIAVKNNSSEAFMMLLADTRVNINAEDRFGQTALQIAAKKGYKTIIIALLADSRTDINRDFNVDMSDEIRDLIATAKLNNYKIKLDARPSSYEPKYPTLHSLGFFVGHNKEEKQIALQDVSEDKKITNKTSREALQSGELGEIVKEFSEARKARLGL